VTDERCSLRLTRRYDVPIEVVWRALADADARRRWLGVPHTAREREPGTVLELELEVEDGVGIARIELRQDGETTVVVLEQVDIPAPRGMRAMRTWTTALDRFEAAS
jgi:hypothetical protein